MRKKNKYYAWDYFPIELAVMLQGPDEDFPPYEYLPEAREIVRRLADNKVVSEEHIQKVIADVMSEWLEHNYTPEMFHDVAMFVKQRSAYIRRYEV